MKRPLLCAAGMLLAVTCSASASKYHGYVTHIESPTIFDLGTYHVVLSSKTACVRLTPPINSSGSVKLFPHPERTFIPCAEMRLRVGVYLRLKGVQPSGSSAITPAECDRIVYYLGKPFPVTGTVLLTEAQHLQEAGGGAFDEIDLDGYRMNVTPATKWNALPPGTTFSPYIQSDGNLKLQDVHGHIVNSLPGSGAAAVPNLKADTWVRYRATLDPSAGTVVATDLVYWPNIDAPRQDDYRNSHRAAVREPNYDSHRPGTIQFRNEEPIRIVPDRMIQNFVSQLGGQIVSQMRSQADGSGLFRFDFRFYVVEPFIASQRNYFEVIDGSPAPCSEFGCTYANPRRHTAVNKIVAMQDGLIMVPDTQLFLLHNRAQLAALLAFAVASVQQEDIYRLWLEQNLVRDHLSFNNDKNGGHNLARLDAFINSLNGQVLRVGIHYMLRAGYDVGQAPYTWHAALEPQGPVVFLFDPVPRLLAQWTGSYGMAFLYFEYPHLDYSLLKEGGTEYSAFLTGLESTDSSLAETSSQKTRKSKAR